MKKTAENRYPHSATLFRFCKEALEIRYNGNVRVIDQDVGSILGYDPADCSHWKKGKKNIYAMANLKSIAEHLKLDERLLIDMASGKIGLEEGIFEYKGYGKFSLNGSYAETIKKSFFKNPEKWQKAGNQQSFEEIFDLKRERVISVATQILKNGGFEEAPVYLPEVYQMYPGIQLKTSQNPGQSLQIDKTGNGPDLQVTVFVRSDEMRPYLRFLIARQLYQFLIESKNEMIGDLIELPDEIHEIQANIFAANLLVPGYLLRKEIEQVNSSADIIMQLAEHFWVSYSLMNQRLGDYIAEISWDELAHEQPGIF